MTAELLAAARLGDLDTLRGHFSHLLDELDNYPWHVWAAALETDQAEVLALCLEAGLDPNGTLDERPLITAAQHRAVRCIHLLLEAGADATLHDSDGRDFLLPCVVNGDLKLVELALAKGVSPFGEVLDHCLSTAPKMISDRILACRRQLLSDLQPLKEALQAIKKGSLAPTVLSAQDAGRTLPFAEGTTLLHAAAKTGNVEAIRQLVGFGGEINALDRTPHERKYGRGAVLQLSTVMGGWTPLMAAADSGQEAAVSVLLELGADVKSQDASGDTALHIACRRNKVQIVKGLLAAGADPNALSVEGGTPLLAAGYFGSGELMDLLLSSGANPSLADESGITPFLAACWEGRTLAAERLLAAGASVHGSQGGEGDVWDALHTEKRTKTLKRLLPHLEVNPREREESPLASAFSYGHLAAVPLLVKAGARPREGEQIELNMLWGVEPKAMRAALEAIKPLGLHLSGSALYDAARSDDLELTSLLVEFGSDPNLAPAAIAQPLRTRIIRRLLDFGADINGQDANGMTALAWALSHEQFESAELLMHRGADPFVPDKQGVRPIDMAMTCPPRFHKLFEGLEHDPARTATLKLNKLLSEYSAPSAADVEAHLKEGANPNCRVGRGFEALALAAANQWWETADLLLAHGAERSWKSEVFLSIRTLSSGSDDGFLTEVLAVEEDLGEKSAFVEGGQGSVCFTLNTQREAFKQRLIAEGKNATAADMMASSGTAEEVAGLWRSKFRSGWCGTWRCHPLGNDRLLLVPTLDPYKVVGLIKPHAGEHDVGVFEILSFLKKHEGLGWTLTGIGYDSLNLEFSHLPDNLETFVQELADFCPDLIDQGFGSHEKLAGHVRKTKQVHLWWD